MLFYEPILRLFGAIRFTHFYSQVNASVRLVYNICLALVSTSLHGVGSDAASTTILFTCPLARLASALFGIFRFTRYIPSTLDICLLCLLSRVLSGQSRGIRSWGFLRSLLFEWAACVSPPNYLGYLRSCHWYFFCFLLSVGVLSGYSFPLLPVYRGYSPKLSNGLPCDWKKCLRNSCPWLLLSLFCDEEYLTGFSSLLLDGLFYFFYHCLVMKKISRYFLPCSRTAYFISRISSFSVMRRD